MSEPQEPDETTQDTDVELPVILPDTSTELGSQHPDPD
jgi:hypothetical protein